MFNWRTHVTKTFDVTKKVQVGNDQKKAQSEKRFPLQKPRREKYDNIHKAPTTQKK